MFHLVWVVIVLGALFVPTTASVDRDVVKSSDSTVLVVSTYQPVVLALNLGSTAWDLLLDLINTTCLAYRNAEAIVASTQLDQWCNCSTETPDSRNATILLSNSTRQCQPLTNISLISITEKLIAPDLSATADNSTAHAEITLNVTKIGSATRFLGETVHRYLVRDQSPTKSRRQILAAIALGTAAAALARVNSLKRSIADTFDDTLEAVGHVGSAVGSLKNAQAIILKRQNVVAYDMKELHAGLLNLSSSFDHLVDFVNATHQWFNRRVEYEVAHAWNSRQVGLISSVAATVRQEKLSRILTIQRAIEGKLPHADIDWDHFAGELAKLAKNRKNKQQLPLGLSEVKWHFVGADLANSALHLVLVGTMLYGERRDVELLAALPVFTTAGQLVMTEPCVRVLTQNRYCEASEYRKACRHDLATIPVCDTWIPCKATHCCNSLATGSVASCKVSPVTRRSHCYSEQIDHNEVYVTGTCTIIHGTKKDPHELVTTQTLLIRVPNGGIIIDDVRYLSATNVNVTVAYATLPSPGDEPDFETDLGKIEYRASWVDIEWIEPPSDEDAWKWSRNAGIELHSADASVSRAQADISRIRAELGTFSLFSSQRGMIGLVLWCTILTVAVIILVFCTLWNRTPYSRVASA